MGEGLRCLSQQLPPDPRRAEPFAFEIEKCEFIEWIEQTKVAIEFETVDHRRFRPEPDVFRAQIAVSFDMDTLLDPCRNERLHSNKCCAHFRQHLGRKGMIEIEAAV